MPGMSLRKMITRGLALACLIAAGPGAAAASAAPTGTAAPRPSFSVSPQGSLDPGFAWRTPDYVVRCTTASMTLQVQRAEGWRAKVDGGPFQRQSFSQPLGLAPGESSTVTFQRRGGGAKHRFHVRCLPGDFPQYDFDRKRAGGPGFFFIQMRPQYAVIFNRDGVPVWWYKASGEPDNAQLLPDGTVAFDPVDQVSFQTGDYEIRTLSGRLLRIIRGGGGNPADIHEIQLLSNGNYLIGAQDLKDHVDTSAYGGSKDSTVNGIEIQEITPQGKVVWRWDSNDHIKLAETGRWWNTPFVATEPYDVVHWNSVRARGKFMLLSFRHLDAVYKVNRRTGNIVWKLGGTKTRKSLEVRRDPHDYPLGGQHDARFAPDGTITIHDNRTGLDEQPRAVRYKINEERGTARLVHSIRDPEVPSSFCCGSARLLPGMDWLVGWGGNGVIGAYNDDGKPIFRLDIGEQFSYRANPIANGAIRARRLRRAMDRMAG